MSSNPSLLELQQRFVDLRLGMFIHFNMATFQDREWGNPNGPTEAFDPSNLDTDQWAECAKSAKMTFGCLTTKHHDGFCLWPTKTSGASILQTPKKQDVVGQYCESFRKAGLRVCLYYSILSLRDDIRHFNVTPNKIELTKAQLTELLTEYGEIDMIVFDGWDAPWSRITYQEIPFREIYDLVKSLQPNCLVADLNASEYPETGLFYTDIKAFEQNAGQLVPEDSILPALSCVTLTDGWFWKQSDKDAELKSAQDVVDWLVPQNRVGCTMILNAAPNREGRMSENIVKRLKEIGELWHPVPSPQVSEAVVVTTQNLCTGMPILASSYPDTIGPDQANDGNFKSAWYPDSEDNTPRLEVSLEHPTNINVVGFVAQGVGRFMIEALCEDRWQSLASGVPVTSTFLTSCENVTARAIRYSFEGKSASVAEVCAYYEPPQH